MVFLSKEKMMCTKIIMIGFKITNKNMAYNLGLYTIVIVVTNRPLSLIFLGLSSSRHSERISTETFREQQNVYSAETPKKKRERKSEKKKTICC